MSIPAIDFSAFRNGTEQELRELAIRITGEFKKHGAIRLIDHGITGESALLTTLPSNVFLSQLICRVTQI
jgi:hypothetical protein